MFLFFVLGKEHITHHSGRIVPARRVRLEDCKHKCHEKLSLEEKQWVLNKFNSLENHVLQNVYLQNCTIPKPNNRFEYLLQLVNRTERVCQKSFVAIHGIKRSRLQRKVLKIPLINKSKLVHKYQHYLLYFYRF